MYYKQLFTRLNIEVPNDFIEILELHKEKQNANEFALRVMDSDEVIELIEFLSDIEVYQNIIPLWTDDNSNYVGVFYQCPLKHRVCYIDHEETDISPSFRSVSSFIRSIEQDPDLDWRELKKEYPVETESSIQDLEDDQKSIDELNHLLNSNDLDDDLRCQLLFSIMALTPKMHLDSLVKYLDDEDMYVQERACEILGYHRYIPAKDKLIEVSESGMHNGKQAAKRALSRLRG
ncbi:HEAT repeat domain-containing protein [Paenibacillus sp. N3/727]|uniref:HEAT repeat domain-containing protein n=1 Tax=Paenibacillus sp. N3/727 TaxID=2925845 RepID=UPI001F535E31|nr:HEAT repeat domain-containing protein [Paenibacillus sp. N3/727]UNK20304.1 HEAT repeat domain-containing protein [Paenibacillus sp. N3/727]